MRSCSVRVTDFFRQFGSVQIVDKVSDEGYRHPRPENCPASVYAIMTACWAAAPLRRPSFAELRDRLDALV